MKRVLIFSGTTEGRQLAEHLMKAGVFCDVCVATEYGAQVMEEASLLQLHTGRLSVEEMKQLYEQCEPQVVVDATHPFATVVSNHIRESLKETEIPYIRLERTQQETAYDVRTYANSAAVVRALEMTQGNILLTTGSKELAAFCCSETLRKRLIVRVLPGEESLALCYENGLEGNQIIAMQGPFSEEMNTAIYHQYEICHMVTKESGSIGGMDEKLAAAKKVGVTCYVIQRPKEKNIDWRICDEKEIYAVLASILSCNLQMPVMEKEKGKMQISLIGIGMGNETCLTCYGKDTILNADYIFGAERMIAPYEAKVGKYPYYLAKDILPQLLALLEQGKHGKVAILFSGDTGFYSGAKKLYHALQTLTDVTVEVVPGISSIAYLAAKIPISWEDAVIVSAHGVQEDVWKQQLLWYGLHERKVFFLTSGVRDLQKIGALFMHYGPQVRMYIGYQLSYDTEWVLQVSPRECMQMQEEGLYVGMIENDAPQDLYLGAGISDELFLRTKVPMTKEEVRHLAVAKLQLKKNAICYDIGCGSGSVAVEMAMQDPSISVYAMDVVEEAVSLTTKNAKRFGLENIHVLQAMAPEGLKTLPVASNAFVGGSRGQMTAILEALYQKNASMRVVVNAISLETVGELMECLKQYAVTDLDITQVQISKAKTVGEYHMMMGQNPVTIVSFTFMSC